MNERQQRPKLKIEDPLGMKAGGIQILDVYASCTGDGRIFISGRVTSSAPVPLAYDPEVVARCMDEDGHVIAEFYSNHQESLAVMRKFTFFIDVRLKNKLDVTSINLSLSWKRADQAIPCS